MKTVQLLLGLLLTLGTVRAAGLIVVDEAYWLPPGPRPPIEMPPPRLPRPIPPPRQHRFAPLELARQTMSATLVDQVAEVIVEQEFHNPNPRRMEGHFLFPVPRGAQLTKFTLEIDGRPVEAELLAADKARQIYEDIVRKTKDPALLEFAGRDLFKVRIFPMEPRETRVVRLSYTQWLQADRGLVEFRLPLASGQFASRPVPHIAVEIRLKTSRALKSVYCPTHAVKIHREKDRQATIGYEAGDLKPDTDLQLFFAAEDDPIGVNLMAHRVGTDPGAFLLLLSPGLTTEDDQVVPKDVVFVLDTSGSMAGAKLEQARNALLFCVENLNESDRLEIIRFATDTEPLFQLLTDVSGASRARARDFIGKLKATGGTAIDEALQAALALRPPDNPRPFVVIFLTDGRPTVGMTDETKILANVEAANRDGSRIFCFGIGHDVNTHLLDKVTEVTRGSSQYVLPEEDLELKVSSFYARIRDPILVNPQLEWGSEVRVTQLHPARLPDLFRGEQLLVAGRYEGEGEAVVRLKGEVNGLPKTQTHRIRFPGQAAEHDFVPRLWATRRVGYLLDEIRLRGDSQELRDEVTDLARRYGIVTPYTALLIVEDEDRRGLTTQSQSLPELQQDHELRQTAEGETRLMMQRYGLAPVARARSDAALKSAEAPAAAVARSQVEASRGFGLASPPPPTTGPGPQTARIPTTTDTRAALAATAGLSRHVGGRTFFWSEDRWLDGAVQGRLQARREQISLGSQAYFELLRRHPETAEWLALGPRVEFLLANTVYEIQD
jgi:Ca-activated chloride channel homolog